MAETSRFLKTDPETLEVRSERFGDAALEVDFAGGPYWIIGLAPTQRAALEARFGQLCGLRPGAPGPMPLTLRKARPDDFTAVDFRGWTYTVDITHRPDAIAIAGPRFFGRMSIPPEGAHLWTSVSGSDPAFVGIVENVLRIATAYRTLERGGVVLHSGAVAIGEDAYVFYGPSGSGKSTVSGWGHGLGYRVLSDELNLVEPTETRCVVQELPFAGDFDAPGGRGTFGLAGLYRLVQGSEDRIDRMRPAATIASLLASAPFVNGDRFRTDQLLANLERIAGVARVGRVTFSLERRIFDVVGAPD